MLVICSIISYQKNSVWMHSSLALISLYDDCGIISWKSLDQINVCERHHRCIYLKNKDIHIESIYIDAWIINWNGFCSHCPVFEASCKLDVDGAIVLAVDTKSLSSPPD